MPFLLGDLDCFDGDQRPGDGRSQNISLVRAVGFDERKDVVLYELFSCVYDVMLVRQLLCSAVSALDIRPRLAYVHQNGDYSIKSIALFEERNTNRCIQAAGIGQYNFRHFATPLSYKRQGQFNLISSCSDNSITATKKVGA